MKVDQWKIEDIKPYENNPRINEDAVEKTAMSIREYGWQQPIVVDHDGVIIVGHTRLKSAKLLGLTECPVLVADLPAAKAKAYRIADNKTGELATWNQDLLDIEIEGLIDMDFDIELTGFSLDDFDFGGGPGTGGGDDPPVLLKDRFVVPPFSILDTRQGLWRDRKAHWHSLIGDSGESRELALGNKKNYSEKDQFAKRGLGVSLLDPVLSEIINRWFGLPNCKTFDCFAGDSIFGYVSDYLGNEFTGIELRQEQTDLNNKRLKGSNSKYICDDGRNVLNHIDEKSQDLLFSCPPYFNLEVYSDLPNDASNQKEYSDFLKILDTAFTNAIKCLKDDRFAVVVVGDVRDKKGFYYRFVDDVKDIFKKNKIFLYNELILIEPIGVKAIVAGKTMERRKVMKVHQNVLVFYKGNPKKIKEIFPEIPREELEIESDDME